MLRIEEVQSQFEELKRRRAQGQQSGVVWKVSKNLIFLLYNQTVQLLVISYTLYCLSKLFIVDYCV